MPTLLIQSDARSIPLADKSIHCCVTSPPYWGLRDYGVTGQLGLEKTPEEYISQMVQVFREVKRVLRDDGTLWLNMGDSYQGGNRGEYGKTRGANSPLQSSNGGSDTIGAPNRFPVPGLKPKDLVGIPWMLAFALRADGWYLRSDIIWSKPNPMPESVTDRPTKAHEYIFLLSKSERYFYDAEAIKEESVTLDLRKPYAPGQVDVRGNGHDRGGGTPRKMATPTGWDTEARSHGTIHKSGRRPKAWDVDMGSNRTLVSGYARKQGERVHGNLPGRDDGGAACNSPEQIVRNKRSVWEVPTQCFPEAHFATFPEELIKPCILAGCPAKCCAKCGAPWENIIETNNPSKYAADDDKRGWSNTHQKTSNAQSSKSLHRNGSGVYSTAEVVGEQPTCDCDAGLTRGIVLDPFMGSGTTALVARNLQCNAVGLELNAAYIEIAKRRLSQEVMEFQC